MLENSGRAPRSMHFKSLALLSIATLISLAGCGGDTAAPVTPPDPPAPPAPPPVYAGASLGTSDELFNRCETPKPGKIVNLQGTQADEKGFIRAFTAATYLWNKEVPDVDPTTFPTVVDYFNALKTPKLTANGRVKDRFHFTYTTEEYDALSNGVDLGYGVTWLVGNNNKIPRQWNVAMAEPGSPAAHAGLRRGDLLLMVDGLDFINRGDKDGVAQINAALTPVKEGEQHRFTLWRDGIQLDLVLSAAKVTSSPVQNARVIDTASGKLGYLTFNSHNEVAEKQLYDAFNTFKTANVSDLVLDMRYNGGGLLSVASELAFMVAGPDASNGKIFVQYATNGQLQAGRPTPFPSKALGLWTTVPLVAGTPLPHLDLKHVTVLAGPNTCSASEAVINGLRGIGIAVDVVGGQTCGKPYAFIPISNCGTTYFLVQYQNTNQLGQGDYGDGFAPTCAAADDLNHALGDSAEGLLALAIGLHNGQACPAPLRASQMRQGAAVAPVTATQPEPVRSRPLLREIAIVPAAR
jgi:C-terminal processing protease CtpA/Prc